MDFECEYICSGLRNLVKLRNTERKYFFLHFFFKFMLFSNFYDYASIDLRVKKNIFFTLRQNFSQPTSIFTECNSRQHWNGNQFF